MKVDLLIVGEEFREDGQDRASIVAGAILFTLSKLLNIVPNAQGRVNLTPADIEAKVNLGDRVVSIEEAAVKFVGLSSHNTSKSR